jgi:hypothetical protein
MSLAAGIEVVEQGSLPGMLVVEHVATQRRDKRAIGGLKIPAICRNPNRFHISLSPSSLF